MYQGETQQQEAQLGGCRTIQARADGALNWKAKGIRGAGDGGKQMDSKLLGIKSTGCLIANNTP